MYSVLYMLAGLICSYIIASLMLSDLVLMFLGGFDISLGFLYLRGFDGLGLFALGFLMVFLIFCWFDVFLIFGGVGFFDFLIVFGGFLDFSTIFFRGFCFAFIHQKGYIFGNSLAILFIWSIMVRVDEVTRKSHRVKFTALRLVLNS